jgi:hypothetical protein
MIVGESVQVTRVQHFVLLGPEILQQLTYGTVLFKKDVLHTAVNQKTSIPYLESNSKPKNDLKSNINHLFTIVIVLIIAFLWNSLKWSLNRIESIIRCLSVGNQIFKNRL